MRSHVLLVADLIDLYRSPRCITQPMALCRTGRYRLDRIHLCGMHYTTPLAAIATHNTPSYAVLSSAGCVATHK